MPLYEYHCPACSQEFEILVRSAADTPTCPACGATQVEKQWSVPAAPVMSGSSLPVCPPRGGDCGLPRCQQGGCQML